MMIFIGVIVFVDFILLGVLAVYGGGRTMATLVVNRENPSEETGVSYERRMETEHFPRKEMGAWLGAWLFNCATVMKRKTQSCDIVGCCTFYRKLINALLPQFGEILSVKLPYVKISYR